MCQMKSPTGLCVLVSEVKSCIELCPVSQVKSCAELCPVSQVKSCAVLCPVSLVKSCAELCPVSQAKSCAELCPVSHVKTCAELCPVSKVKSCAELYPVSQVKSCGCLCLVCAVLCVVVTVTTTVLHMNRLQTLHECEYIPHAASCTCTTYTGIYEPGQEGIWCLTRDIILVLLSRECLYLLQNRINKNFIAGTQYK